MTTLSEYGHRRFCIVLISIAQQSRRSAVAAAPGLMPTARHSIGEGH